MKIYNICKKLWKFQSYIYITRIKLLLFEINLGLTHFGSLVLFQTWCVKRRVGVFKIKLPTYYDYRELY